MRDRPAAPEDPSPSCEDQTLEKVGDLLLAQPRRGYRYGLDPFLLAHFVEPGRREKVVDLGTGCGIIALLLSRRFCTLRVWGVELQSELAMLADWNVARNGLAGRCTIVNRDIRTLSGQFGAGFFDRVVANPPFRPPRSGRISPRPQRAIARQEIALTLQDLASTASRLLRHGGLVDMIHLPERLPEIFQVFMENSLEPKRLRLVHSFVDSPPEMVLLSARKGGRPGLRVEAPFVVFEAPGKYTAEAQRALHCRNGP